MTLSDKQHQTFQHAVQAYYRRAGRHDLPWRQPEKNGRFDPYKIMLSEIMLQQTTVARVIPKYREFLQKFPDLETLAAAPPGDVLRMWSGLGYNRRARFLWQASQRIMRNDAGEFPRTFAELTALPGIGDNTAGAILAYAFNEPVVFIETNIRTVFIHHFFTGKRNISDQQLLVLIQETLDSKQPREWYWALMDYGAHLKQTVGNLNRRSGSYAKQSKFEGSRRQIRGRVLRVLGEGMQTRAALQESINDERLPSVLDELSAEQLIIKRGQRFSL